MTRATILWAVSLFCVHVLLVTTPVLLSNATGEDQGWLTFFADFPLIAPMLGLGFQVDRTSYLIVVCILGPLMYAAVGAAIGRAIERHKMRHR